MKRCMSLQYLRASCEEGLPCWRRASLERCFEQELLDNFSGRILPVTQTVADHWGVLTATRQRAGSPLGLADGLIAATALEHGRVLVTRNTKHFLSLGIALLNSREIQPRPCDKEPS